MDKRSGLAGVARPLFAVTRDPVVVAVDGLIDGGPERGVPAISSIVVGRSSGALIRSFRSWLLVAFAASAAASNRPNAPSAAVRPALERDGI